MNTYGKLETGTSFSFGSFPRRDWRNGGYVNTTVPLTWIKTGLNGFAICTNYPYSLSYDHALNATGNNKYEKVSGKRLFPLTALYKYLNCADVSYNNVVNGDYTNRFGGGEAGFLSRFSDEEIRYIEPHTATIPVPSGYTKQYKKEYTYKTFANLPTVEQLGTGHSPGTFGIDTYAIETWTTDADTLITYNTRWGGKDRASGRYPHRIAPVIKIKDDAPIDKNGDGSLIIRIPEKDFEGDLFALFGWEKTAA